MERTEQRPQERAKGCGDPLNRMPVHRLAPADRIGDVLAKGSRTPCTGVVEQSPHLRHSLAERQPLERGQVGERQQGSHLRKGERAPQTQRSRLQD